MEPAENDEQDCDTKKGLTTSEALLKLSNEITGVLHEHEESRRRQSKFSFISNVLHHSSEDSLLCWISLCVLILEALLMIVTSLIESDNSRFHYLGLQGLAILLLVAFNLGFVLWDRYLRSIEISQRVKGLIKYIEDAAARCDWRPENYPHVCTPYSPCITLQWTYRDGVLVNLPWALLVTGDLVLIRPGQPAPGHCTPTILETNLGGGGELRSGEVYSPVPGGGMSGGGGGGTPELGPSVRKPLACKAYKMLETPYVRNLQMMLGEEQRPPTYHDRARRILFVSCIEKLLLPAVLVCMVGVGALRLWKSGEWSGSGRWGEMLVTLPVACSLPLLPLVFPSTWLLLMGYGNARIAALLHTYTHYSTKRMQKEPGADPFDETEIDRSLSAALDLAELKHHFLNELFGRGNNLTRSSNILHALGSITSLCCVDKKGILSWPNPTAEKIFFLRKKEEPVSSPSASSLGDVGCSSDTGVECASNNEATINRPESKAIAVPAAPVSSHPQQQQQQQQQMQAEVLDLTHDHSCPFRLEFDDALWSRHLASLKPLGLAILLNTCSAQTHKHYTRFCSHVTCEALYNEDLVPVTNRRCLCEVAKQIGFTDKAVDIFQLESQLSTFRHVEPESVRNDMRFAKSLPASTKLKFPFPHMVAVIVRDLTNSSLQLFSQGTADIVLDSCTQYWDGEDLCRLSPADRRKVQDFYQRTSLSAYCTAFAYRPLFSCAAPSLSAVYMELPTDSQHLYNKHNRPPIDNQDHEVHDNQDGNQDGRRLSYNKQPQPEQEERLSRCNSNDSMFDEEDVLEEVEINDIEGCFKLQCNQIFIGMVTMQYQAQADIVQLIEQLERACIRFVHFSKENELRSRVFSEKMGLESGWNCHISLLSERTSGQNLDADKRKDSGYHLYSDHQHDEECNLLEPLLNNCGTLCSSRQMSMSAPCSLKPESGITSKNEEEALKTKDGDESGQLCQQHQQRGSGGGGGAGEGAWQWQSLSCLTDSTEQSVPVNFDMSNRAKLPRGIDKIRPHIELVDNVPLLVSLFTDCTPATTTEMISIMQHYGEVAVVIGSSVNADNLAIFLKANASVAVEPLYPQVCQKVSVYEPVAPERGPSPVEISKRLNSIPCSISMQRNEDLSLFHLIKEARNFMMQAWNCTQFWVCCIVSLSCTQLLATTMLLPPLLSTGQVLYFSIVFIPSLALSLVATPMNKSVMQRATGKNTLSNSLNSEVAVFVMWCYGSKFLPTVVLAPLLFGALLSCYCRELLSDWPLDDSTRPVRNSTVPMTSSSERADQCEMFVYLPTDDVYSWGGWSQHPYTFLIAQHFVMLLLSVHFIIISSSFVHRDHLTWRRLPFTNKLWSITSLIILLVSALYALVALSLKSEVSVSMEESHHDHRELEFTHSASLSVFLCALVSPVIVLCINELVKWQEIKVNVRYQKRARLEFGTKLGMNSPF